jgi:hypothetical protein
MRPGLDPAGAAKLDEQLFNERHAHAEQAGHRALRADASLASLKDFLAQIS